MPVPVSTITLSFEGMLVIFAANDLIRPRPQFEVGILKNAPEHVADVLVTKTHDSGAPTILGHWREDQIENQLWLDVQDVSQAGPALFIPPDIPARTFNRAKDVGDDFDFRWAVDFEGLDAYNHPIDVDLSGFKVLRINNGTFSTQTKSSNPLERYTVNTNPAPIGEVAVVLKAEIKLDLANSVAYFSNGASLPSIPLAREERTDYGIYVSNVCSIAGHKGSQDSDNYYTAIGSRIPPSGRIRFKTVQRITPDAACFTAWLSQTDPG
jgi:hypothetical protein